MGLFDRLFSKTAREITDGIGNTIDNLSTSDQEKLDAKNELTQIVTEKLSEIGSYQRDVLVAEIQGKSVLQRIWRPLTMLAFAFVVLYAKFIAPLFGLSAPPLEGEFWTLLQIGIGGYVAGRSIEKISDRVTRNTDLTFLRKKDRKDKIQDNGTTKG